MKSDEVKNLAHLARISVGDAEIEAYTKDFDSILAYVDAIQQVQVDDTAPTHLNKNTLREDIATVESGAHTDTLLAEAPDQKDGYYKVGKIL